MTGLSNLTMQLFGVNGFEWIIIVIIGIIIIFGAKKIPELARSFGRASTEYQKAKIESKREIQQIKSQTRKEDLDREKLETIADTLGIDHVGKTDSELRTYIEDEFNKRKK